MAALIQRGVFVRKPPAPPLDRCIRLSVGSEAERDIVAAELRRILNEVPGVPGGGDGPAAPPRATPAGR